MILLDDYAFDILMFNRKTYLHIVSHPFPSVRSPTPPGFLSG